MMNSYNERVEQAGGKFAEAYARAMKVVKNSGEDGSIEQSIAESLYTAILDLRRADSEFYSARERVMRDLNSCDGSKPGETLSSMSSLSSPWGVTQLSSAAAAYDSALRHFWSVYDIAATWDLC